MSAANERPVYVDAPDGPILAIHSSAANALGNVVLFGGGWHGGSVNANRLIVRMARALAASARNVVRFDWSGAGESPGYLQFFRLDEPSTDDGLAAVDVARRHSDLPTSLVGICIGTRAVMAAAPQIDSLEAVALVSFPLPAGRNNLRRTERIGVGQALRQGIRPSTLRGWFQPATRRVYLKFLGLKAQSLRRKLRLGGRPKQRTETVRRATDQANHLGSLVRQLEALAKRKVRVLLLFGAEDAAYREFLTAQGGPLGRMLERNAELIDVRAVDGDLSGFSSLEAQQTCIDQVTDWLVGADKPIVA